MKGCSKGCIQVPKSETHGEKVEVHAIQNKVKGIPLDHKCNKMNTKGMFASIFKFGNGLTLGFFSFYLTLHAMVLAKYFSYVVGEAFIVWHHVKL